MSARGLHDPNTVPTRFLFHRMKSCSAIFAERVVCAVIPVRTQVPPLRVSLRYELTSSPAMSDGATTTLSAITP